MIETTEKTYTSDTQDVREYVNRVFSNSTNIPLEGCWDKLQHYVDDMSSFNRESQTVEIVMNGHKLYFNPRYVVTIKLVKL